MHEKFNPPEIQGEPSFWGAINRLPVLYTSKTNILKRIVIPIEYNKVLIVVLQCI